MRSPSQDWLFNTKKIVENLIKKDSGKWVLPRMIGSSNRKDRMKAGGTRIHGYSDSSRIGLRV